MRELESIRLAAVAALCVWSVSAGAAAQSYEITTTGTEQTFPDMVVGLSSPTNAQETRLSYGGINGYWIANSDCAPSEGEEITFTFSTPVQRVEVAITAASEVGGNDEAIELDANGAPYTLVPGELDNSTPAGGIDFAIVANQLSPEGADDARGTYTATAAGAGAPISTFTIRNVVASGCPNGSVIRVIASDPLQCGNGVVEAGEDCDDGGESATCDADCTAVMCGDGVANATAGETCDDGGESASCDADCTAAMCGDGVTNGTAGESCDDGGESASCDADCTAAMCGDGVTNATAGESCDDGGESASCDADCTAVMCGDGVTNATAGEDCDDGGESAACDADCTAATCGDGVTNVMAGEACDDGEANSDTAA
ncbi:MAG TPA: hypothetical protein RMI62_02330, partial [Polyangiaceae bacterium LLY-WYZ-15_(1-7)]|nr:hypothetical protein [Polyangiaceae bacterium LLY-WYZ-15_(1-7)]